MKRTHKPFTSLLAIMMMVSLTACGGNAAPAENQGESTSANTESTAEERSLLL